MHCDRKTVSSTQVSQVLRIISHQAGQNRALHVNKSLTTQQTPSTLPHSRPNLPPTPRPYRPHRPQQSLPPRTLPSYHLPTINNNMATPQPIHRVPKHHLARPLRPALQTHSPTRRPRTHQPHRALILPPDGARSIVYCHSAWCD
jgi:hypothetical protein